MIKLTRATLMDIDKRRSYNLMKRNPDGSEELDVDMLREIVEASRETGASVWIRNERIYPSDLSGMPSTDGQKGRKE